MSKQILHRLYVGLNDKDTKARKITVDSAKFSITTIANVLGIEGMTIFDGDGIYKHHDGKQVYERTLILELLFATSEVVKQFADNIKRVLNQESIGYQAIELDKCELI